MSQSMMTSLKQLPPITDRSYGILALRYIPHISSTPPNPNTSVQPSSKNTQILLIQQKSLLRSHHAFWTFPKGHAEADDPSQISTAIRELREETNLSISHEDILTFPSLLSSSAVGPREDGAFVERYINPVRTQGKEVRYWVALLSDGREQFVKIQQKEVADARWCAWDEGEELLEFEEGKGVLRAARDALDRSGGGRCGVEAKF